MTKIGKVKVVCFDVNGTLMDDTKSFPKVINGVFEAYGMKPLPIPVLKERFGQPWTKIYREEGLTEEMASEDELYKVYNELYRKEPMPKPFPGLRDALRYLKSRKMILAIISTQQDSITVPFLKRRNLHAFFSYIESGVGDKEGALYNLARRLKIQPEEVAYVGDQTGDIIHAKNAGCISIAFAYKDGIHEPKRLIEADPTFLISKYSDFPIISVF